MIPLFDTVVSFYLQYPMSLTNCLKIATNLVYKHSIAQYKIKQEVGTKATMNDFTISTAILLNSR